MEEMRHQIVFSATSNMSIGKYYQMVLKYNEVVCGDFLLQYYIYFLSNSQKAVIQGLSTDLME